MAGSADLNRGKRSGEEIDMDDGPLSKESGSHKQPGFPTKSTKYSLKQIKEWHYHIDTSCIRTFNVD